MNGILLINKKKGVTSRDVVNEITHIFNTKKVGHTGTLDPIASGVLVITIGKYTKLNEVLTSTYKEYIATMQLGILTDTLDITGKVIKKENIKIDEEQIKEVLKSYIKTYEQVVPIYSAIKVKGKKLYEYARNNEEVELPKKEVDIKSIELISIDNDLIKFKCYVSKGTYIRSLIRDIASSLNTVGVMTDLIRTKQGKFNIEDSFKIEDIKNNNYKLLDIDEVLDLEIIDVNDEMYKKVFNGVKIKKKYNKDFILFKYNNKKVSLYKSDGDEYKMYLSINE